MGNGLDAKRTFAFAMDCLDGLQVERRAAAVDQGRKHLIEMVAYLEHQVVTVFDLIAGVLIAEAAAPLRSAGKSTRAPAPNSQPARPRRRVARALARGRLRPGDGRAAHAVVARSPRRDCLASRLPCASLCRADAKNAKWR
jgi:hypothetical protein